MNLPIDCRRYSPGAPVFFGVHRGLAGMAHSKDHSVGASVIRCARWRRDSKTRVKSCLTTEGTEVTEKNRFSLCVLCGLCGKCRFSGLGYRAASDAPTERGRLESGFSQQSAMHLFLAALRLLHASGNRQQATRVTGLVSWCRVRCGSLPANGGDGRSPITALQACGCDHDAFADKNRGETTAPTGSA